jgi:hypothetical protein
MGRPPTAARSSRSPIDPGNLTLGWRPQRPPPRALDVAPARPALHTRPMKSSLALLAFCLALAAAPAGGPHAASAGFSVRIQLNAPDESGVCLSARESNRNQALVRVVCRNGTFVSIEAIDAPQRGAQHGLAPRYFLSRHVGLDRAQQTVGSETEFRVLDWSTPDNRLERLVQF